MADQSTWTGMRVIAGQPCSAPCPVSMTADEVKVSKWKKKGISVKKNPIY